MSLDYYLDRVADYKSVCFDNGKMNLVTEQIIFLTMAVGLGEITHENVQNFYARAKVCCLLFSTTPPTPEQVYAHIGLRTNVSSESDASWRKRMIEGACRDYRWEFRKKMDEVSQYSTPSL